MSINWYPGHMNKATREIRELLPKVDVIIELVDARLPYSSANPVIASLAADKPCLKLLNKSDLADPEQTRAWLDYLQQQPGTQAMAISTKQPGSIQGLVERAQQLAGRSNAIGNVTALITGIPNVGKSTLINTLAGRQIARAGNEPAVTQRQQRIDLRNGLVLIDSPGILWPKIANRNSGYRLALSGAIKATAMREDDVGIFAAEFLRQHYPQQLQQRYKLDSLADDGVLLLEQIGRQRGCLGGGGHVDFDRAATLLINEFRNGALGALTLETPQQAESEQQQVAAEEARREEQKAAKKQARKQNFQAKSRR